MVKLNINLFSKGGAGRVQKIGIKFGLTRSKPDQFINSLVKNRGGGGAKDQIQETNAKLQRQQIKPFWKKRCLSVKMNWFDTDGYLMIRVPLKYDFQVAGSNLSKYLCTGKSKQETFLAKKSPPPRFWLAIKSNWSSWLVDGAKIQIFSGFFYWDSYNIVLF